MRFAVFFHVSMLSMKVNSIVILNFHWDLLYIVDMSECEKGSFWEVSVPKTSAAAIFSGDLYIFAKYAPVFSNSAFPSIHLPPIATAMCERTSKWGHSIFVRFLGKMSTDREHWQVRERYYPTPPHPCVTWHIFNVAWRMCAIVRTCKWTCRGVTSWECASTWTLLPTPHPTPAWRDTSST